MRCTACSATLVFLVIGCLAAGCEQTGQSRAYPPDPLLQCWKPAECKAKDAQPALFAYAEPNLPSLSGAQALAQNRQDSDRAASGSGTAEYQEPKARPPLKAEPASRRKYSGFNELFGHAQDYRWLIGTLEENEEGQPCLRFVPANGDIAEGGVLRLTPNNRLAQFQAGDLLFVEGKLSNASDRRSPDSAKRSPVYHVQSVKLLEKAG